MRDMPGENPSLIKGVQCTVGSSKWGNFRVFYGLSGISLSTDFSTCYCCCWCFSEIAGFLLVYSLWRYCCGPLCLAFLIWQPCPLLELRIELLTKREINYDQNINFNSLYTAFFSKLMIMLFRLQHTHTCTHTYKTKKPSIFFFFSNRLSWFPWLLLLIKTA